MNKTILISIGLICSVITAAGIMWYKSPTPIDIALRQLHDKDYLIRLKTLNTLYNVGDKSSIPEIARLLNDDNIWVRTVSLWVLQQFGPDESIPTVKKLLEDKDERVKHYAEQALHYLGMPYEEVMKIKWKERATQENIIKLREQLRDEDESVRYDALFWLGEFGDTKSIPEIEKLLNDKSKLIRERAEHALRRLYTINSQLGVSEADIQKEKEGK